MKFHAPRDPRDITGSIHRRMTLEQQARESAQNREITEQRARAEAAEAERVERIKAGVVYCQNCPICQGGPQTDECATRKRRQSAEHAYFGRGGRAAWLATSEGQAWTAALRRAGHGLPIEILTYGDGYQRAHWEGRPPLRIDSEPVYNQRGERTGEWRTVYLPDGSTEGIEIARPSYLRAVEDQDHDGELQHAAGGMA